MLLSIIATDRNAIRVLIGISPLLFAIMTLILTRDALQWTRRDGPQAQCANTTITEKYCAISAVYYSGCCVIVGATSVALALLSRPSWRNGRWSFVLPPRAALAKVWRNAFVCTVSLASYLLIMLLVLMRFETDDDATAVNYLNGADRTVRIVRAITFYDLALFIAMRRRIRVFLTGKGADAEAASAASGVSAMIGATQPTVALAKASQSFKAIAFDQLSASDFDGNTPAATLGGKAEHVTLGHVDFFLSHSWHDSPARKWEALEKHCTHFHASKGRSARLWLDRACLNQNDIASSLPDLPTHMAGCKHLLILAGPTYVKRLWTLLEIFVWNFMKDAGDIRVLITEDEQFSSSDVVDTFRAVRIEDALCSSAADKEKVVSIIEASFSDLKLFDQMVTSLLLDASPGRSMGERLSGLRRGSRTRTRGSRTPDEAVSAPDKICNEPVCV